MVLIFGGAYNGKIKFVKEKYNLCEDDFFYCRDEKIEFDKKVICGLHMFTRECVIKNINSLDILKNNIDKFKDKIIITDEINSGIVPMKKEDRVWREESGKAVQYLASNSDEVYRIFFGLYELLKEGKR